MNAKRVFRSSLVCLGMLAAALLAFRTFCRSAPGAIPAIQFPAPGRPLPDVTWERAPQLGANLPDRLPVYRVTKAKAGPGYAEELARLFDIAAPVDCQGETCAIGIAGCRLWLNGDGTFSYVTEGRWPEAQSGASEPCTDQEAADLAESFLVKRGLLPQEFSLWRIEPAIAIRGDTLQRQTVGKTVLYHRTLNDLPVYGVSRVAVDIAHWKGQLEVAAVSSYWHPVEPYQTLPLRSVDAALVDLEAGIGAIDLPDSANRALVERVSLGYWEDPEPARQPFVQPVYQVEGTAWVDGQAEPFVASVAALDPSVIQRPGAPATSSIAAPVVPDTVPASAVASHDGQRISLGPQARQALPGAFAAALEGSAADMVAVAPASQVEAKVRSQIGVLSSTLEIAYPAPVRLALTLDDAPRGSEKDEAQRTVITLDQLIVLVIEDELHLACLPGNDPSGDGVIFTVPRGPGSQALEQIILGR